MVTIKIDDGLKKQIEDFVHNQKNHFPNRKSVVDRAVKDFLDKMIAEKIKEDRKIGKDINLVF